MRRIRRLTRSGTTKTSEGAKEKDRGEEDATVFCRGRQRRVRRRGNQQRSEFEHVRQTVSADRTHLVPTGTSPQVQWPSTWSQVGQATAPIAWAWQGGCAGAKQCRCKLKASAYFFWSAHSEECRKIDQESLFMETCGSACHGMHDSAKLSQNDAFGMQQCYCRSHSRLL